MTDRIRIRIAALFTLAFLAGISALGIALHTHAPVPATAPAAATAVQQHSVAPAVPLEHEGDE